MSNPYLNWTGLRGPEIDNLLGYYVKQLELLSKNKIVLDIGCGTCYFGLKSKQFGAAKVIGLDNNALLIESLRKAKESLSYDWLDIISMDAMDLPDGVDEPDVAIIGDNLPRNLIQAMWHLKLMDLAIAWPNVKIIPNKITLTGKIVLFKDLDKELKRTLIWQYDHFNEFMNCVVLSCVENSPMTLQQEPKVIALSEETILTMYDYDNRNIKCGSIKIDKSDGIRWLQLTMYLGDDKKIYTFDRQVNFIPIDPSATLIKMNVDKRKLTNTLLIK